MQVATVVKGLIPAAALNGRKGEVLSTKWSLPEKLVLSLQTLSLKNSTGGRSVILFGAVICLLFSLVHPFVFKIARLMPDGPRFAVSVALA